MLDTCQLVQRCVARNPQCLLIGIPYALTHRMTKQEVVKKLAEIFALVESLPSNPETFEIQNQLGALYAELSTDK